MPLSKKPGPIWATRDGRLLLKLYAALIGVLLLAAIGIDQFVLS